MALVLAGGALLAGDGVHAAGTAALPLMFGAYTSSSLQVSGGELTAMNGWLAANGASGVALAGDFMSLTFNPAWNVPTELNAAWNAGLVPFVNLTLSESWEAAYGYYDANCATAAPIAAGLCDNKIALWADAFKAWAIAGRKAFISPMPEMNSDWVSYGTGTNANSPAAFVNAYKRVQAVFVQRGVSRSSVRWVFAPNGWSEPSKPWQLFENYYPGDDATDVVAFSAYNYGGCPADSPWRIWDTFETAMAPYLARMRTMAAIKPLFIAQTGTVDVPDNPGNYGLTENKSAWMRDTLGKLAAYPAVRAVIYFNKTKSEATLVNCAPADYRIFQGNSGNSGFLAIMKDARLGKWDSGDSRWDTIAFADPAYAFDDVKPVHPFSGEPNVWYFDAVQKAAARGITNGCSSSPPRYCPRNPTTRAQMAAFLVRAKEGEPIAACTTAPFADVASDHPQCKYIKRLAELGITSGCGAGNYCPSQEVTRAQMAAFLVRAKEGEPAGGCTAAPFPDVPPNHPQCKYIKRLVELGITSGCGAGNYCPANVVTRDQMATFLARAFNW